ncbi:hypothetical protein [Leptothoe kymatousa]|uniref:Uncharacterized protein n=1 Tax=Leptothoe kymatousa TAU-MAC 1615 TaxID=2364775 RepID=A0ABS5Y704_9CYAN|nr:hypothetical protein [Leptothoe kymatousa]MBT9313608.1 hypothetical protein [Leptothoe kymatousa TAU-MAC 1615]
MFFPFCNPSTSGNCSSGDLASFYANCQKMRLEWLKASRDRMQVHLAAINAAINELESQVPADTDTEPAA